MTTIKHDGGGYEMKFSAPGTGFRSYKVHAKNVKEMQEALEHHYGGGPSGAKSHHTENGRKGCPLCRMSREEAKKKRAG
jgi:hypothetical protein